MNETEFKELLEWLQFPESSHPNDDGVSAFARWLPCGLRSAQRYASGELPVPEPIAKLMRAMRVAGLTPEEVAQLK